MYDWDWPGAEKEFKRAIELNPRFAWAHDWYAGYLATVGRLHESLAEERRAVELEPLELQFNMNLGFILYYLRQYDQAIQQCKKSLELDPNYGWAYSFMGLTYRAKGQLPEAIQALEKGRHLLDDPQTLAFLASGYAFGGRKTEAQKLLNALLAARPQAYVSDIFLAWIYTGLGDKDRAFEFLGKAVDAHSPYVMNSSAMKVEPIYDSLRSDPRFTALLQHMGL